MVSPSTLYQLRLGVAPSGFLTVQESSATSPTACTTLAGFLVMPISVRKETVTDKLTNAHFFNR